MENVYGIGVANRYALFIEDEEGGEEILKQVDVPKKVEVAKPVAKPVAKKDNLKKDDTGDYKLLSWISELEFASIMLSSEMYRVYGNSCDQLKSVLGCYITGFYDQILITDMYSRFSIDNLSCIHGPLKVTVTGVWNMFS